MKPNVMLSYFTLFCVTTAIAVFLAERVLPEVSSLSAGQFRTVMPVRSAIDELMRCASEHAADRAEKCTDHALNLAESTRFGSEGEIDRAQESFFDVYMKDNYLIYIRKRCREPDVAIEDFALTCTRAAADGHGPRDFERHDFTFSDNGYRKHDECVAVVALPDAGVRNVRTGQYEAQKGLHWEVVLAR